MDLKTYHETRSKMVIDKNNIPDFIWVYPKLPGETLKKIDMRFIQEIIRDLEKEIHKI